MKTFAKVISVLLHPLLIPTLMSIILILYAPHSLPIISFINPYKLVFFIWIITFIIPLFTIFIYFLWRKNLNKSEENSQSLFIKSMLMEAKEERIIPFTITTALYAAMTYFLVYQSPLFFKTLTIIFGGITMCLAIVTFISRYWKISAHSAGVAGGLGFLFGIYINQVEILLFYPILIFMIFAGALMSSRLYLNSHTLLQVAVGALTGFSICLGSMLFFG